MIALAQESGTGDVAVPPTIQALLAARIDQLDPGERAVLERGSVEGRVFHRSAVEALAPDDGAVATRLTSLVRKELVRSDKPAFVGHHAFRFRHLLIRDAAYEALAKATRAELHERFAGWLQTHGGDLVELDEILGYHLEQAYSYRRQLGLLEDEKDVLLGTRAAACLGASGRRAAVRGDAPAAARFLERAAALLPTEDPRRLELLTSLGGALIESAAWDRARDVLSEAEATAQRVGDRGAAAHARVRLVFLDIHTNPDASHTSVRAELEGAIRVFEALGDKSGLARALHIAAMLRMWGGQNARAREEMELAAQHAREVGDRALEIDALSGVVMTLVYGPEPVATALKRIEEIERESQGARRLQAVALRGQAGLLAMAGSLDTARELIMTADRIAVRARSRDAPRSRDPAHGRADRAHGRRRACGRTVSARSVRLALPEKGLGTPGEHRAAACRGPARAGAARRGREASRADVGLGHRRRHGGTGSPRGRAVEAGGAARRRSRRRGVRARRHRPVGDR